MVDFSSKPNSEPTSEPPSEANSGSSAELGTQPSAKPQLEAFADIERLYSRGDWSEALDLGQALLANLQVGASNSLRLRLELLIGHTLVYGFGKQAEAEQHYRVVQQHSGDSVLLAIASQGLQLCSGFAADPPVEPLQLAAGQASGIAMGGEQIGPWSSGFPPQDGRGAGSAAASDSPAVFPPLPSALPSALEPADPSPLSSALEPGSHAKPWLQQTAGDNFSAANIAFANTLAANTSVADTTITGLEFPPTPFANNKFSNSEFIDSEFANAEFDGNELAGSHFDGAAFPGLGGGAAALFPWQDSQDVPAFNPATTHAAPAIPSGQSLGQPQFFPAAEPADELAAVPAPVRLKVTVASAWAAGDQTQPALSAAEMAELAKGLLELVLE
jgi:hypothetical protein